MIYIIYYSIYKSSRDVEIFNLTDEQAMEHKGKMNLKDWHIEDILAAVRKKKKSLAALSRENGLAAGTLNNALRKPWPRGEKIIAQAIGLTPGEIWPSRYPAGKKKQKNAARKEY